MLAGNAIRVSLHVSTDCSSLPNYADIVAYISRRDVTCSNLVDFWDDLQLNTFALILQGFVVSIARNLDLR